MADEDNDLNFDFEAGLEPADAAEHEPDIPPDVTAEEVGQQPANFKKNYRQTVCTYWLRGLCMKGDSCGFLHQFDPARMPVCRNLIKTGKCDDMDCPYKHSLDEIKECNMYKLGFCIYGSSCRYKHTKQLGPPPDPAEVEGAKPREFRDKSTFQDDDFGPRRHRGRLALASSGHHDRQQQQQQLALPAPEQQHDRQQDRNQQHHQQHYQQQQQQQQQQQGHLHQPQLPPQFQQQQGHYPGGAYPPAPGGMDGAPNMMMGGMQMQQMQQLAQMNPAAAAAMMAAAARASLMQQQHMGTGGGEAPMNGPRPPPPGGPGPQPPPPPPGRGGPRPKGMPSGMHLINQQAAGGFLPGMAPAAMLQGAGGQQGGMRAGGGGQGAQQQRLRGQQQQQQGY